MPLVILYNGTCGRIFIRFVTVGLTLIFQDNFTDITPLHFCYFRDVYHCPFCNLCRVGKGLGIDYFHCMTCNCCLGMKASSHKCLEKGLETNCPICCDFLFTSSATVRALPCGHYMHSACFQVSPYLIYMSLYVLISLIDRFLFCPFP